MMKLFQLLISKKIQKNIDYDDDEAKKNVSVNVAEKKD